jgi:cation transport regulator ChaC
MFDAPQFVFGYGSLVAPPKAGAARRWHPDGFVADLRGFRRAWGVAMDNRRDLPGYKYYTDPGGARPAVFVCFLDVAPAIGDDARVNGLCVPVGAAELAALDVRERNYERVEVTDAVWVDGERVPGRVWTYAGRAEARERLRRGVASGTAVIDGGYLRAVRAGFASLGEAEGRACAASLDPGAVPVVELVRHELPADRLTDD